MYLILYAEVQLKADLSQIRDENARITEEMERLKAQLTETLERTEAVQKLIAAHKHDDSRILKIAQPNNKILVFCYFIHLYVSSFDH